MTTASEIVQGLLNPDAPRRTFATQAEFDAYKAAVHEAHTHRFGDFWLNTITRECSDGHLSPMEYCLLVELVLACPDPLTGDELGRRVSKRYGLRGQPYDAASIRVYVRRVRQRIGSWRIAHLPAGYVFVPFKEGGANG